MYHYTYYLYNKVTQQHYYGVRTSKIKPEEDLFVKYFSSSKLVRELINQHGLNSFNCKVRKIFSSRNEALIWEHKVLKRLKVRYRPEWLNISEGDLKFGFLTTEERRIYGYENALKDKRTFKERSQAAKKGVQKQIEKNSILYYNNLAAKRAKVQEMYPNGTFLGKKHSENTINKFREIRSGPGNSQYGTFWITNGVNNQKIKIGSDIPKNWYKGRKLNK